MLAARDVIDFASHAYGPSGGDKLVDGDDLVLVDSAASALREMHVDHPQARPYKALATNVQATVGDGATTALLLAARLVVNALEALPGLPIPASLEGYQLAKRQALALLSAQAAPDPEGQSIPNGALLLAGVRDLGGPTGIDLDAIDIRAEPGPSRWLDGLVIHPTHRPEQRRLANAAVMLSNDAWVFQTQTSANFVARTTAILRAFGDHELAQRRDAVDALRGLGVDLLVTAKHPGAPMVDALLAAGIMVWTDAPKDAMARLAAATDAKSVARPSDATSQDLGRADLSRRGPRETGWLVQGPGPSATWTVPQATDIHHAARIDQAERALRLTGAHLQDPRSVPGGGQWQASVARGLERASAAAPGKTALGVANAAKAMRALVHDLVRNSGRDPLGDAPTSAARDSFPAMHFAVSAAFEVAAQILRLDGQFNKRPSSAEGMRGGTGPSGSPKGMPGDVPPLM